jgi:hypothetical protein
MMQAGHVEGLSSIHVTWVVYFKVTFPHISAVSTFPPNHSQKVLGLDKATMHIDE